MNGEEGKEGSIRRSRTGDRYEKDGYGGSISMRGGGTVDFEIYFMGPMGV